MKLIEELREKVVVVEGKNDKRALEALGIKQVIAINGKPLIDLIPQLKGKDVAILTDFDRRGRQIYAKLRKLLQAYGIKHNPGLRKQVARLGKKKIEEIKEGDFHGEDSTYFHKIRDPCFIQSGWGCGET